MKMIPVSEDALDSLKRMVEELERDAARWRYIASMFEPKRNGWWIDATLFEGAPSIETFSDAIDRAMNG